MRSGAIIGFGKAAELSHWPGWAEAGDRFRIEAVADPDPDRVAVARRLIPGARAYGDPGELFSAESGRIDFVDLCTPPASHAPLIEAACERGLDVLCEKPLVLASREMARVRRASLAAGVAVVPVHNWRNAPIWREAMRQTLSLIHI